MINLELYRVFYYVASEKNITKASEKLNISQPAVSKHIKELESLLGSPLFIRTKRGVILNEFGESIYLKVKQALNLLDESEKDIKTNLKEMNGTIKLGVSTSLMKKYLLKYLDKFHKLYPNIDIIISTDMTYKHINMLKNGNLDLIISKFPNKKDLDLEYKLLDTTKYIFVCSDFYQNLLNRKVSIKELTNYPLLLNENFNHSRESVNRLFKKYNLNIKPKMEVGSSNLIVSFSEIGYGISYVTELYVKEELENKKLYKIDLIEATDIIEYGIITLRNNIQSKIVEEFINFITT